MSILEAIICGIVQGACEFLPVSSSGHLALLHGLFGIDLGGGNLLFDLLLHLGTLIAVAAVYGKDIAALIRSAFSLLKKIFRGKFKFSALCGDERTVIMLVVSTFPLALAAFFKDKVEALSTYPKAVGVLLILNGLMLIFGGFIKAKDKKCEELGAVGALGIGMFQLIATFPGISRSGSTITGGTVFGLKREEAVRFSFLMSIPAIIGANIFSVSDALAQSRTIDLPACAVGTVTAAIVGVLAIKLIKKLAASKSFNAFGIYCIAAGLFAVLY